MAKDKITGKKLDELIDQCYQEYKHALKYRQQREGDWATIDDLYFGKKKKSLVTRANIHVPKMQGTIETFLSKVDDPPYIHYEGANEADRPKAVRLNALVSGDMKRGMWKLKDVLGKKVGAMYGRIIFKKYSTSENGFTDYLEVVDPLDFVIDPLAGGLVPMQYANYLGQDNIIKSVSQLKDDIYDQAAVKELATKMQSDSDVDNEYRSKQTRRSALGLSDAVLLLQNHVRLVEWYTYWNGERMYVLFSPEYKKAVRACKLKEVFESEEFPFATWAPFALPFEFWTPGLGELIKEPNIVQNIILSQLLDNNAYRNYGQVIYDINRVPKPGQLKPTPMGKIGVQGNPKEIIMNREFPAINQGVDMYNLVENIFARETGVTGQSKGMPNTKRMSATEFAGLLDEVADRFFTSNELYATCLARLAELYYYGVQENMTEKHRVRVLGARGYEWDEVNGSDLKGDFDILISSGATDEANKNMQRDRFIEYMKVARTNTRLNQKFLDEKEARMFGMEEDEVERLLSPDMEGDWEILAEAAGENETMLTKDVEPNRAATAGHVQKHLDFVRKTNELKNKVRTRIVEHAKSEIDIAIKNEDLNIRKMLQERRDKQVRNMAEEVEPALGTLPGNLPSDMMPGAQGNPAMPQMTPEVPTPNMPVAPNMPEAIRYEAIRNAPPNA